jgi:hypothetical protein
MTYGINYREGFWMAVLAFCVAGGLAIRLGYDPVLHAVSALAGFTVAAPLWIKGAG